MNRKGQARVLNEQELKDLRKFVSAGKNGKREVCLIDFSYLLGLRVKELASLKLSDVVDDQEKIRAEFTLQPDQTKGGKARAVYLSNKTLIKSLKDYLPERHGGSYLFTNQKGGNFTAESLQVHFNRLYKKSRLDGCSSHSGRRTFATRLIEAGIDLKAISTLMGHANVQTTAKYVQDNPVRLANAVANL